MEILAEQRRMEKAAELADEITGRLQTGSPVDPFSIAAAEHPRVRTVIDDFGDRFDGRLEYHRRQRRFLLFVNNKYDNERHPSIGHHPRTRFSAAHELGHLFIDRHRDYLVGGGNAHGSKSEFVADQMVEREADAFAAALLLPTVHLRPIARNERPSVSIARKVSADFGTSLLCAMIRLVKLSDFPCALAGIRDGAVKWMIPSNDLISHGLYPMTRAPLESKTGMAAWDLFTQSMDPGHGHDRAGRWFQSFDDGDLASLPVDEEYIAIRTMGTLAVLITIPEDAIPADDDAEDEDL